MPAKSNIVKIAVEMESKIPQLIDLNQEVPLHEIISNLCKVWTLSDSPAEYALQLTDTGTFITEKNRHEIKNASFLRMTYSPARTARDLLEKLRYSVGDERKKALQQLVHLSSDAAFALEFIDSQGKDYLTSALESGCIKSEEGLGLALEAFVELMNHTSWDSVGKKFIAKIVNHVNGYSGNAANSDPKVLINALAILESAVSSSSTAFNSLVEAEVTLPNLISHVHQNASCPEIQQNSIALINALFAKSDLSKRKAIAATLSSKHFRNVILNSVVNIERLGVTGVGSEMAHQLYVLQTMLFNLYEERINCVSLSNPSVKNEVDDKINELRAIAFDSELSVSDAIRSSSVKGMNNVAHAVGSNSLSDDYLKLGFSNAKNPAEDFAAYPGLFSLDLIMYFARNYPDQYMKIVLENCCRADREHECPFIKSAIRLTKLLIELFKLTEPPSDEGKLFYPMFFTRDHPLEELFVIAVKKLSNTWKEMRATNEDFVKVFAVLKQQLSLALSDAQSTSSFELLQSKLSSLTYLEIMNIWQKERSNREEWENKAPAILELREMIKPEIVKLIEKQRLQYLTEGTLFVKYSNKGQRIKDKFWFCRLSSNHRFLHYGDTEECRTPSVEELSHKLAVADIKCLVVGKECPHMKDAKSKKSTFLSAFSLLADSEQAQPLNFVAPNEKTFDYWTDGLNALLKRPMTSKEAKSDLETLLSLDIKLRLLDTEGITIPEVAPPIPRSPPNFNFAKIAKT